MQILYISIIMMECIQLNTIFNYNTNDCPNILKDIYMGIN